MPQTNLTAKDIAMIRVFRDEGVPVRALAREYGCSTSNVYLITSGQTHKGYTKPRKDRAMTDATAREVKKMIAAGATDTQISDRHKVSRGVVYMIRVGKSYRDV